MRQGDGSQTLVTVAAVNFAPVYGDAKATVEKMAANVEEAAAQGADLVVFPEGAHGAYELLLDPTRVAAGLEQDAREAHSPPPVRTIAYTAPLGARQGIVDAPVEPQRLDP